MREAGRVRCSGRPRELQFARLKDRRRMFPFARETPRVSSRLRVCGRESVRVRGRACGNACN